MTVAGVIALAALATIVASLGYLHLAPTGLSPIRNAVSQYGITPFRAGYRVATLAFAVAGAALAVGIDRAAGSRASAVARPASGLRRGARGDQLVPDGRAGRGADRDRPDARAARGRGLRRRDGRRVPARGRARDGHALAWAGAGLDALGALMAACLLGLLLARSYPGLRARFGAIERGFYVSAIAWFAVFAVACAAGAG